MQFLLTSQANFTLTKACIELNPKLESIISKQRLGRYLTAAAFDPDRTLALYAWNMKIGAAFFPLFSAAEVALRNRVSARLCDVFGAVWWTHPVFTELLGSKGKGIVLRAVRQLDQQGLPIDSGRVTASLSFGFWENMLLPKYSAALWNPLHPHFPDFPERFDQAMLFDRIGGVCTLRNRISHHEPIFDRNISGDYTKTMELIGWLSNEKAVWIRPHCEVMALLRRKP